MKRTIGLLILLLPLVALTACAPGLSDRDKSTDDPPGAGGLPGAKAAGVIHTGQDDEFPHILPRSAPPGHLLVLDIAEMDRPTRYLAAGLQGLINRQTPRVYLVGYWSDRSMQRFLDYYATRFGVTWEDAGDLWELVERFGSLIQGAVVYDPDLPETVDVATTLAGLENLVVLHPDHLTQAAHYGIAVVHDLRHRWQDKFQAFDWAVENLLPDCTDAVVADLEWDDVHLRDYLVQHRVFTFRYKAVPGEFWRLKEILNRYPDNTAVLGYLASSGTQEALAEVALSGSNTFLIPSDHAPNLSVHSGLEVAPEVFSQKPVPAPTQTADQAGESIFVAFAFSDGDNYAIPMKKMLEGWDDPVRGTLPFSWTIPLTAPTLAPGMAAYYYETATPQDRFTTISGVGYAYPFFYGDRNSFIELTARYMDYLGMDDLWVLDPTLMIHGEILLDDFLIRMAQAVGLRGYVANYFRLFERNDFASDGTPVLYTMISYPDDPVGTIRSVIDAAKASKTPGVPVYLFFGLNIWEMLPSHVAEALEPYENDETVRPVLLPHMFDLMRRYPPGIAASG